MITTPQRACFQQSPATIKATCNQMVDTTGGYTELEKRLLGSESKHALRSLCNFAQQPPRCFSLADYKTYIPPKR
jgi:hypothetical protein